MIHISDIVNKIESFLYDKGESKFKIFVRINFNIDVYVISTDFNIAKNYQYEFINNLIGKSGQDSSIDEFYKNHYDSLKIKFNIIIFIPIIKFI